MRRRKPIAAAIVFILMLGCIRLAHELSGSTEDGNLLVNGVAAGLLTTFIIGIYSIIKKLKNKQS